MNLRMWLHPATQRNVATLRADGVLFVGPDNGEMACGEYGPGRMSEPLTILAAIEQALNEDTRIPLPDHLIARQVSSGPLQGKRVVVTSGPTHEPIDPVRYIANRSSGKQGHAIARAAALAGAEVILVSGPVALPDLQEVRTIHVETAREILAAVETALPADIFIAAAAVADWRMADEAAEKIKKGTGGTPVLSLVENPDILATVAHLPGGQRPGLVIGFAAETEKVLDHAKAKLQRKGCDMIIANDVSAATGIMGGECNRIDIVTRTGLESWPSLGKDEVARRLVVMIGGLFAGMAQ